jgi:WhiB family redox-sensing transcriptional regulator
VTTTTASLPPEGSGDPKPAFERVAAAWLAREVDGGQRLDPGELAREVSVTPRIAAATLAALRASRERDPGCGRVRMLLARDRIQEAFVVAELRGDARPLDPDELARQAGVTTAVARQWLRTLRAARHGDPTLAGLRGEPAEHRPATPEQLAALRAAYADGGRPQLDLEHQPPADHALERIEQLYRTQEQHGGRRLDAAEVACQVGVGRAYAAQTLAALRGGAMTSAERIEQLWRAVERDGGRSLAEADAARMLRLPPAQVREELGRLRGGPPATPVRDGGRLAWIGQAACRDHDPELFFPERGHARQGTQAKQVCASCQVRQQCRELAVRAAKGRNQDHGIFGGTKPHERTALRDNPGFDRQRHWLTDQQAAEQAHQLAVEVGPQEAAKRLGTAATTLRRAWDRWGLDYPGRPRSSPYARDREHAQRAFRLAEELGSTEAAAEQLGSSRPALRAGWQRFGLGQPDTSRVRKARQPAPTRLDWAFLALNLTGPLAVRTRNPRELGARVRRAEQEATLGYRVTVELTAENRRPSPHLRAWAVRQRAHRAQQRVRERGHDRDEDQEGDRAGERARWRQPERGGAER